MGFRYKSLLAGMVLVGIVVANIVGLTTTWVIEWEYSRIPEQCRTLPRSCSIHSGNLAMFIAMPGYTLALGLVGVAMLGWRGRGPLGLDPWRTE